MKRHPTQPADRYLGVMAVLLFLSGAALILTGASWTIGFAVITIAAALTVVAFGDGRPRGGAAH